MAAPSEQFAIFLAKLNERQQAGAAARNWLAAKLASMTSDQLKAVSPTVFVRLGPKAFAEMASRSAVLNPDSRTSQKRSTEIVESSVHEQRQFRVFERLSQTLKDLQQRKPLLWEAAKRFVVATTLATIFMLAAPLAIRAVKPPILEHGQPLCMRLDRFTGGCVFLTASGRITLRRAAEYLVIPIERLSQANPKIPVDYPLPSGIHIQVPRRLGLNLR